MVSRHIYVLMSLLVLQRTAELIEQITMFLSLNKYDNNSMFEIV